MAYPYLCSTLPVDNIFAFILLAMSHRKLTVLELNRLSPEAYREARKLPLVVVLDDVRSVHNVGSVFRTADAFRIGCIFLCGITAVPPSAEMHKTALGAEFTVKWTYYQSTMDAVQALKTEGYTVFSVEQTEGSTMLQEAYFKSDSKYAIVLGNEVKGVNQEVIDISDGCLEIPQQGTKHSLNVSVAAGVVLWEIFRQIGL